MGFSSELLGFRVWDAWLNFLRLYRPLGFGFRVNGLWVRVPGPWALSCGSKWMKTLDLGEKP